jgi:AcrR family transcriptional regulator
MGRKEDIVDAAVELFAQYGYSATPASALAKKAGVAKGLIFHHFKNKAGILSHILTELSDSYIQGVESLIDSAQNGLDAVLSIIRFHFEFASERSTELTVLLRDFPIELTSIDSGAGAVLAERLTVTFHQIRKCIERGQADGSITKVPAADTAFIIRGMLNGISRLRFQMPGVMQSSELCSSAMDFCCRSLVSNNKV